MSDDSPHNVFIVDHFSRINIQRHPPPLPGLDEAVVDTTASLEQVRGQQWGAIHSLWVNARSQTAGYVVKAT